MSTRHVLLTFLLIFCHLSIVCGVEKAFFSNCTVESVFNMFLFPKYNVDHFLPNYFNCRNVSYTTNVSIVTIPGPTTDSTSTKLIYQSPRINICEKIGQLEIVLNQTCYDVLCNANNSSTLDMMQRLGSSVEEWINACQYCGNNSLIYRKMVKLEQCNPKLNMLNEMINYFPTRLLYCGEAIPGFPFLFSQSSVKGLLNDPFSYYCACSVNDSAYFHKCFYAPNKQFLKYAIGIMSIILAMGQLIITFFLVFIPKLIQCIKLRSLYPIITVLYITIKICCEFGTYLYTYVLSNEKNNRFVAVIVSDYHQIFLFLALFSWLGNWSRIVLAFVNKRRLIYSILIYAIPIIVAVLGVVSIAVIQTFAFQYIKIFIALWFLISICSFLIVGSIIARVMKKVSDINIWDTGYAKFLIFVSLVFPCYLLMVIISLIQESQITGMEFTEPIINAILNFILYIVVSGLIYMEFNLEELKICYHSCIKCGKSSNSSNNQSPNNSINESLLDSTVSDAPYTSNIVN